MRNQLRDNLNFITTNITETKTNSFMILFYIIFGWFFFVTLGLALFELRPDKERLYRELKLLKESCKYKVSLPIAMFVYLPFSIYNSLKKIFGNNE